MRRQDRAVFQRGGLMDISNAIFVAYEQFYGQFINRFGSPPRAAPGSRVPAFRVPPAPSQAPELCITYTPVEPRTLGSGMLTQVTVYDRDLTPTGAPGRHGFYGRVNDVCDQITSLMHSETGATLLVGDFGAIELFINIPFQPLATGETDPTYVAKYMSVEARGYVRW